MKKLFLSLLSTLLVFALIKCGDNSKNDSETSGKEISTNFEKRYSIKSGRIEYEISGSQVGTKSLYFDKWGMRQAEYTRSVISVGGFTKLLNLANIIDGDFQYIINMDQKSGTKTKNPILKQIEELKYEKNYNEFGEQMLLKLGAEKIGNDKFMGKDCAVYEMKSTGTKMWIWNWLTLKSETNSGGISINLKAVKIEEGGRIPGDKFAVPEGVVLNEVDIDDIENRMREENK
jgi:hypothetical protein